MRNLFFILILLFTALSCQKNNTPEEKIEVDLFYRLSIINQSGTNLYSKIITTKNNLLPGELRGEANTGGDDDDDHEHYEGDGCDESKPNFCKKHPKHKKCLLLGEKLEFFELQKIDKTVIISWKALDESGISKYILERSTDAKNYKSIYSQLPKGTINKYSYKDFSR